jgi:maleylacetoacetate isomerase
MADPVLYGYWRSSAAYRVRIAINLKGIAVRHEPVNLKAGAQKGEAWRGVNPLGLVPVYEEPGGFRVAQSLAIIEYLEETHPHPPLLPGPPRRRALVRELALAIAADVHPIGNLRVLDRLTAEFGADPEGRAAWNRHWMGLGFAAIEQRLSTTAGRFAVGEEPTLADICIVPQVYNARRFGLDLGPYPLIRTVDANARALPAFADAAPESQVDAEKGGA